MIGEEAFTAFVVARTPALSRTAYLLTGSRQDAEDLVQLALFQAAKVWHRIEHQPEPYVRRILYNENISRWRYRSRRPAEYSTPSVPEPSPAAAADVADRFVLEQALARLTPKQRTILVLRFYEDLSEAQTAAAAGIRLGTVKSQTRHALTRLRELAPELADMAPEPRDSSAVARVISGQ